MTSFQKTALSTEEIERALEGCANEPIHIPGMIQPFGVMLTISPADMLVRQVSANVADILGRAPADLIERPVADLLGDNQTKVVKDMADSAELETVRTSVLSIDVDNEETRFDASIHSSGGLIVLEMEPAPGDSLPGGLQHLYDRLRDFSVRLQDADTPGKLCRLVVEEVRDITGYDRVKLYQFDEDWNGTVVAESRAEYMDSYLDLRFPASDIPEQARRLLERADLRLIADRDYSPVEIIPADNPVTGQPIDLGLSTLRSVSPIHLQYLKNMNVGGSLTVSIVDNGKLWGLIACHHADAIYLPLGVRRAAELMGHIFWSQLLTIQDFERSKESRRRELVLSQIGAALTPERTVSAVLELAGELYLSAVDADGFAYVSGGTTASTGETPTPETVEKIISWLNDRHTGRVYSSSAMGTEMSLSPEQIATACGILAVPLATGPRDYALWFRAELVRHVNWAGGPEKTAEQDAAGFRLTPRGSFESWQETVRGTAPAWLDPEIATAQEIARMLTGRRAWDLETIMRHTSALIRIRDREGRYLFANRSMLDSLGRTQEEVLNRTDRDLLPPDIARDIEESDAAVLRAAQPITREETLPTGDGEAEVITVKFPLYDSNGEIYGLCSISTDISERKEAERLLEKYARDLERSNRDLEHFAYLASHDLQEPLRAVSGFTRLLRQKYADQLDDKAREYISFAHDGAERMSTLITDLLTFSRVHLDDSNMALTDLNDTVDAAMTNLGSALAESGASVSHDVLPVIVGDAALLTSLFQNLIGNAIKYHGERTPEIRISAERLSDDWRITVADNGIGIDSSQQERIFQLFARLHGKDEYSGTGIGLAICRRIVETHEGTIGVESEPGAGSRFYFTLPADTQAIGLN